jgi:hypothetical protein
LPPSVTVKTLPNEASVLIVAASVNATTFDTKVLLVKVWVSVVPTTVPVGAVTALTLAPLPLNKPVRLVVVATVMLFGPAAPVAP